MPRVRRHSQATTWNKSLSTDASFTSLSSDVVDELHRDDGNHHRHRRCTDIVSGASSNTAGEEAAAATSRRLGSVRVLVETIQKLNCAAAASSMTTMDAGRNGPRVLVASHDVLNDTMDTTADSSIFFPVVFTDDEWESDGKGKNRPTDTPPPPNSRRREERAMCSSVASSRTTTSKKATPSVSSSWRSALSSKKVVPASYRQLANSGSSSDSSSGSSGSSGDDGSSTNNEGDCGFSSRDAEIARCHGDDDSSPFRSTSSPLARSSSSDCDSLTDDASSVASHEQDDGDDEDANDTNFDENKAFDDRYFTYSPFHEFDVHEGLVITVPNSTTTKDVAAAVAAARATDVVQVDCNVPIDSLVHADSEHRLLYHHGLLSTGSLFQVDNVRGNDAVRNGTRTRSIPELVDKQDDFVPKLCVPRRGWATPDDPPFQKSRREDTSSPSSPDRPSKTCFFVPATVVGSRKLSKRLYTELHKPVAIRSRANSGSGATVSGATCSHTTQSVASTSTPANVSTASSSGGIGGFASVSGNGSGGGSDKHSRHHSLSSLEQQWLNAPDSPMRPTTNYSAYYDDWRAVERIKVDTTFFPRDVSIQPDRRWTERTSSPSPGFFWRTGPLHS